MAVTVMSSATGRVIQRLKSAILNRAEPLTLTEEIAAKGIKVYPLEKVRTFQREHLQLERMAGNAGEYAEWERVGVEDYQRRQDLLDGAIPGDIQKTIRKAQTIPGAKVFVERFWEDPFLFIVRKKAGHQEEACIAYWNAPGFKL